MSKKRKSKWALVPSKKPEDQLYNRRLISYFSLLWSAIWFEQVLILIFIGLYYKTPLTAPVVTALLGVPASLAGLGFYNYLRACKLADQKEKLNDNGKTEPEPSDTPPPQEVGQDNPEEKEKTAD